MKSFTFSFVNIQFQQIKKRVEKEFFLLSLTLSIRIMKTNSTHYSQF